MKAPFLALAIAACGFPAQAHDIKTRFIQLDDSMGWCCGKDDCHAGTGKITFHPDGKFRVHGLARALAPGDRGFYWSDNVGEPWFCWGTSYANYKEEPFLRCLIMPRPEG